MRRTTNLIALVSLLSFAATACTTDQDKTDAIDVETIATEGPNLGKSDSPYDRFQGDIGFDQRVAKNLPAGVRYHLYRMTVTDQNPAFIDLASRVGDDMFLILYLKTSSGWTYQNHNDDCSSNTLNSCLTYNLEDGEYLILVSTYSYVNYGNAASADYELEVFCQGGACAGPQVCGTRGASACGGDEYCDWGDNSCGVVDAPGTCQAIPTACTKQYSPVCGCDGITYSNDCFAAMAGTDVDYNGVCRGSEGSTCGGIAGLQCNDGLGCDMSNTHSCNIADAAGECSDLASIVCTLEFDPVCGCNGIQYGNDCQRRAAGATLDPDGLCFPL